MCNTIVGYPRKFPALYCCWLLECDKMDKEISELNTRILNLTLVIDEEDAQPKPGQENDIERVNENDKDKITKPKPDIVVTTNNDDIANPKPNLGVQKTLVPVNVPKKRVKRKCWTKLKSGLFGWKIMTEANTQNSVVVFVFCFKHLCNFMEVTRGLGLKYIFQTKNLKIVHLNF